MAEGHCAEKMLNYLIAHIHCGKFKPLKFSEGPLLRPKQALADKLLQHCSYTAGVGIITSFLQLICNFTTLIKKIKGSDENNPIF